MPHAVTSLKRPSSYSHCPLKKRPLKYDPMDESLSDSDQSQYKGLSISPALPTEHPEPENLSTKPEDLRLNGKEKSISIPPPISLVAGSRDGNSHPQESASYFMTSSNGNRFNCGSTSHPIKPNGPLEPISLNQPTTWSKINPSYPMNFPGMSRTFDSFNGSSSSLIRPSSTVPQFSSHYTPITGCRDSGSPPHVSPPLSHEPAYPVLRIEENNRSRMLTSPSSQYNTYIDESFAREMYHQRNETHQQQHHHHHHVEEVSSRQPSNELLYSVRSSPVHSPMDRDSVISHGKVDSQNQFNGKQIVPTNVNGSVRYQCPDCSKSYSTFSGLSKHLQFHCASQNKKSFVCKFCEKEYVSLGALKMHIRTHTLPCKCDMCGKAFSRPWLLQGHIRTHTGEKPFSCQHCNRAFADRSNLRAHLQTHSEVKKYSCKSCSKTFSRMSLLVKHEEGGCTNSPLSLSNQE